MTEQDFIRPLQQSPNITAAIERSPYAGLLDLRDAMHYDSSMLSDDHVYVPVGEHHYVMLSVRGDTGLVEPCEDAIVYCEYLQHQANREALDLEDLGIAQ